MAGRQDPPGHALVIIAGPKAGADGKNGRMGPPGGDRPGTAGGTKASPEEAQVMRSGESCLDCNNYDPQQGLCSKVDGSLAPDDRCWKFFDAISGGEPDADDQAGGMDDQDSDDDNGGGQAA